MAARKILWNINPLLEKILNCFDIKDIFKIGTYHVKDNVEVYCAKSGQLCHRPDVLSKFLKRHNPEYMELVYNSSLASFFITAKVTVVSVVYSRAFQRYSYMFYNNYHGDYLDDISLSCYSPDREDHTNPIFLSYKDCLNYCVYMNERYTKVDIMKYLERQSEINTALESLCKALQLYYQF